MPGSKSSKKGSLECALNTYSHVTYDQQIPLRAQRTTRDILSTAESKFWHELGIFITSARSCDWPDSITLHTDGNGLASKPTHVLLIADPQIIDRHSYPNRNAFLFYVTRTLVDLNMRKNWWAALRKRPDVVVFLGDMMDNGRYELPDEDDIFKTTENIPLYFLPGNHDIGLGNSPQFSPFAKPRYSAHFGMPNQEIYIANHSIILFDAPSYADEDSQRNGQKISFEKWVPITNGSLDFVKKFASKKQTDPVILLSHIPLYRPDGKECGPLREKGTLRPGVGQGYQNTLEKKSSQRLLESLKPVAVFSGDDHDYCEYTHHISSPRGPSQIVREVTIKTISMVMNVGRPGFQLLSLAPAGLRRDDKPTYADTLCLLPDQLGIYLRVYIPLLAISLLILLGANIKHGSRPSHYKTMSDSHSTQLHFASGGDVEDEDPISTSYFSSANGLLSRHPSIFSPRAPSLFVLRAQRRPPRVHTRLSVIDWFERVKEVLHFFWPRKNCSATHRRGPLFMYVLDIRDVAIFPLCTFIIITWWFTH